MRENKLDQLKKFLRKAANDGTVVDLSAKLQLSADMACRMVFGKHYMDEDLGGKGFKAVMREDMLAGSMDTSATIIEWAILELLKNPKVIKRQGLKCMEKGREVLARDT
ncbi:hypothetical protein RJT34_31180 [Clitoria ternatea]|uniref:Uncharacterized protein n=1 Tax=Clitoria ternatea TaxID=43366 RepID=A0AAN9I145_CLITE